MLGVQSLGPTAGPWAGLRRAAEATSSLENPSPRALDPDRDAGAGGGGGDAGASWGGGDAGGSADDNGGGPADDNGGGAGGRPERDLRRLDPEREAWVILVTVPGLGPVTFARLMEDHGTGRGVLDAATRMASRTADPDAASGEAAMTPDLARRIADHASRASQIVDTVRAHDLAVVTLDDAEFPDRLRRVEMPPPLLFVRGSVASLSAASAVAVVGTRAPSDRGRKIAAWIGSALAQAGTIVVSGLAVGVDGVAHAAVVAEGRPTVAVLGGGHAHLFPRAHERLADAIVAAGGAVVAELPPDTPATRGTFPRRNRVVSGLSDATVVVEAGRRSGALITAGWALEQGRDCFLVPGPLDATASEGCNLFLRNFAGEARIVAGIPELLEDLGLAGEQEAASRGPSSHASGAGPGAVLATLGPLERSIAERLTCGPATADELCHAGGLSGGTVLSALTMLELRGLVTNSFGRYMAAGALARWPGRAAR
jgi:DNA processing protein